MVIKDDGTKQPFSVDKITARVEKLMDGLNREHMMVQTCIEKVVKYAQNGKSIT
jgi:transcriptional regulator NrdR family protein